MGGHIIVRFEVTARIVRASPLPFMSGALGGLSLGHAYDDCRPETPPLSPHPRCSSPSEPDRCRWWARVTRPAGIVEPERQDESSLAGTPAIPAQLPDSAAPATRTRFPLVHGERPRLSHFFRLQVPLRGYERGCSYRQGVVHSRRLLFDQLWESLTFSPGCRNCSSSQAMRSSRLSRRTPTLTPAAAINGGESLPSILRFHRSAPASIALSLSLSLSLSAPAPI